MNYERVTKDGIKIVSTVDENNVKNGPFTAYFPDGSTMRGTYIDDEFSEASIYNENGDIESSGPPPSKDGLTIYYSPFSKNKNRINMVTYRENGVVVYHEDFFHSNLNPIYEFTYTGQRNR